MKAPIRIESLRGVELPVSDFTYLIELAKEVGYKLKERRIFECPYKSDIPCFELVLTKGRDRIRIGSSIHSFQFFVFIAGVDYTSDLHPTGHYFAKNEFTAIMVETYPRLSSSLIAKKFSARVKNRMSYNLSLYRYRRQRKLVKAIQAVLLLGSIANAKGRFRIRVQRQKI
jgi:hypothetical protein